MTLGKANRVSIRELAGLHTLDIRVAPGTPSHKAVCAAIGRDLPVKTGETSKSGGDVHTLCLAPDWWLLVGKPDAEQRLVALRPDDQLHFSVVDVSGQRTTIELEGPHARQVLAHVWEQDLRDKSFPVGAVSQGLLAKAPVIVHRVSAQAYRVMVRSSFAVHVWKILVDAAAEWI